MKRRRLTLALLCAALTAMALPATGNAFSTGIGDQQSSMFGTPAYKALTKAKLVRYIAPYDAVKGGLPEDATNANAFLSAAKKAHKQILVAFYQSRNNHGSKNAPALPSTAKYKAAVQAFIKKFPYVKEYQPWNEANRGTVTDGSKTIVRSPTPTQSAGYYKTLSSVCKGCKLTGVDLLDGQNIAPSIKYLKAVQKALGSTKPKYWGLHNYSDTNRNRTTGTAAFIKATKGEVWLTETGGIVNFGKSFPGGAKGEARAANALKFMFKIAASNKRITRLYIFQWTGAPASARFDAGLTEADGQTTRPGYDVVLDKLG